VEEYMKKSKRAMKRIILTGLYNHLQEHYDISHPHIAFVDGVAGSEEMSALLAFKSDPTIDEYRSALDRIESGTYGACIRCKTTIHDDLLVSDPVRRVCVDCEKDLNHVSRLSSSLSLSV
jgi:RNA polymerase-binding transcription factor DksA